MHCHIAWHVAEGFGLQFLESPSQIVMPDRESYEKQCSDWGRYDADSYYKKDDSGL